MEEMEEEDKDDSHNPHQPKRALRKNTMDDSSSKRASGKTAEDDKSTRSHRSNLEKTLGELPGDVHRSRRDEKSTSARSTGGKTTTTHGSSSSTGTSSLEGTSASTGKMSRRSSRKDHGLATSDGDFLVGERHSPGSLQRRVPTSHSSNSSVSSGESGEREAIDGTKERRRRERVRSARERLLDEEAKVMRLQEAARQLEEKRILEEARLEALREEARRLEQSLGQGETAHQKKKSTPKVAKRYGAAVGDMSQVPPAFQTWSKNHQ